jgi:hypothetical protein
MKSDEVIDQLVVNKTSITKRPKKINRSRSGDEEAEEGTKE